MEDSVYDGLHPAFRQATITKRSHDACYFLFWHGHVISSSDGMVGLIHDVSFLSLLARSQGLDATNTNDAVPNGAKQSRFCSSKQIEVERGVGQL